MEAYHLNVAPAVRIWNVGDDLRLEKEDGIFMGFSRWIISSGLKKPKANWKPPSATWQRYRMPPEWSFGFQANWAQKSVR